MNLPEAGRLPASAGQRRRLWLGALAVAWGAQAIVTQSLVLREALVLMFGSELAWGTVLFAWLLGVALGAALGGWLAEHLRRAEPALVLVLLGLSLAGCAELWVFRGARGWLGVQPGELLPLGKTLLAALLFVPPASALVGMAFPLACCVGGGGAPRSAGRAVAAPGWTRPLSLGQVYALESAGSLVGGAWFSFWAVEHLAPIQVAVACAVLTTAGCAGLLAVAGPRRAGGGWGIAAAGVALLACGGALVGVLAGEPLNRWLVQRRWRTLAPGYELLAETESKYQNLAIGRRAGQYTLYCDGQVAADFPDRYSFVPLAHFWLCQHPAPRRVLVLGGGAEGLLAEILRHPVESIDYVEPDPRQIALLRPYLAEADRRALGDPRVAVHYDDARHYVKLRRDRFDLAIARLPEPTSALHARLYTAEFWGELRRALRPRAVLCLTVTAAPGKLPRASRVYLASIRATLRRHFAQVIIGWGDPAQVLAATSAGLLATDPAELARRYARRGVESEYFDPAWFEGATDWLQADKIAARAAELDRVADPRVSTDLRPWVYVQRLVLWEAMTAGGVGPGRKAGGVITRLRSVRLHELVALLVGLGLLALLGGGLRRRGRGGWAAGAVTLSVGASGFATMALSIVWLFAFQNLYGYVYQRIGWIIALFMAGLVVGCAGAQRLGAAGGARRVWSCLIAADLLLALLALAVPLALAGLAGLGSGPGALPLVEGCVSLGVVLTGVLGGAAFPLASRLQLEFSGRPGSAAGSVVAADHAGACLGALLCGILLVPIFGTRTTVLVLAGMKLGSAALLACGRQLRRAA